MTSWDDISVCHVVSSPTFLQHMPSSPRPRILGGSSTGTCGTGSQSGHWSPPLLVPSPRSWCPGAGLCSASSHMEAQRHWLYFWCWHLHFQVAWCPDLRQTVWSASRWLWPVGRRQVYPMEEEDFILEYNTWHTGSWWTHLGESTDSFISATTPVVVGGLSFLDQPRLQQSFEESGLNCVVCVLLNCEALVGPSQVSQAQSHMAPRVGREVKRTLLACLFPFFTAAGVVAGVTIRSAVCVYIGRELQVLSSSTPLLQLGLELLQLCLQLLYSMDQSLWHAAR